MRNVIDDNVKRNCVTRSMKVQKWNEFNNNEAEKNENQSNLKTENKSSKKNVFTKVILKSNCVTRSMNEKKSNVMIQNDVKDDVIKEENRNFKSRALNATTNYLLRSENSCPKYSEFTTNSDKKGRKYFKKKKEINSFKIRANIGTKLYFQCIPKIRIIEEGDIIIGSNAKKLLSKVASKINKNNQMLQRQMYSVPTAEVLQGHDTSEQILKSIMLFWANSGRGNFSRLSDVLITNDFNKEQKNVQMFRYYFNIQKIATRSVVGNTLSKNFIHDSSNYRSQNASNELNPSKFTPRVWLG